MLKKALELGLQAVVVVNKIDRPSARPEYVVDKTFDLFCDLNANDMQSDFQARTVRRDFSAPSILRLLFQIRGYGPQGVLKESPVHALPRMAQEVEENMGC